MNRSHAYAIGVLLGAIVATGLMPKSQRLVVIPPPAALEQLTRKVPYMLKLKENQPADVQKLLDYAYTSGKIDAYAEIANEELHRRLRNGKGKSVAGVFANGF